MPNGKRLRCYNKSEASWLYAEVQGYLKHGIEVRPGDTVFDVGANVGAFSFYVNDLLGGDVDLYSFEPIPEIFKALSANARVENERRWKCFPFGLSENARRVEFSYYPLASALSNAFKGDRGLVDLLTDALVSHPEHAPFPGNLLRIVPKGLRRSLIKSREHLYFKMQNVVCDLRPLSEVIREQNIMKIDLLKVDVERSELDVLLGVSETDWPLVKQVVTEVHDLGGRVEIVKALFVKLGFHILKVEQEAFFEGTENYNIYAKRPYVGVGF